MAGYAARHMAVAVAISLAAVTGAAVPHALAGANTILIVDGSNSMNSPADGGTRLDGLKAAVADAAPRAGNALDLGVVAFGTRQRQNCGDVVTLVPARPGSASQAGAAVASMQAQGVSSVAQALHAAAKAASYQERAASLVLVADGAGVESCQVNTCSFAAQLERDAVDLRVHVIAFHAKREEIANLQCIATATGGTFTTASSRGALSAALSNAFARAAVQKQTETAAVVPPPRPKPARKPAPAPTVAAVEQQEPNPGAPADREPETDTTASVAVAADDEEGSADDTLGWPRPKPIRDGAVAAADATNESVFAPTGAEPPPSVAPTTETPAPAIAVAPDTAANESVMAPSGTEGGADDEAEAPVIIASANDDSAPEPVRAAPRVLATADPQSSGPPSKSLPAPDETTVLVRRDPQATEAEEDTPEETAATASDEAANGRVKLAAFIIAGTKPIPSGIMWQILEARDGSAENLVARSADPTPELELAPGEYLIRGVFGNATRTTPVTVSGGKTAAVSLVLDAGGLQIIPLNAGAEDPDAEVLNTIYATDDPTQPVVRDAKSNQVIYLNAGTYRVESRFGNANAVEAAEIKIQAGKLVKAKINHRAGAAAFKLLPEGGDTPLTDTAWQVLASDGRVIAQSRDTTPSYVFAEGAYDVVVRHAGKTYRASFQIRPGQPTTSVEIVAR